MSVVAMESYCMEAVMIHLVDKAISYYLITKHVSNLCSNSKVCSLLEWCFIISKGASSDQSQLRRTDFAVSH